MNDVSKSPSSTDNVEEESSRVKTKKSCSFLGGLCSLFIGLMTKHWFGVLLLPATVVLVEFYRSLCGGMFFTPVSRWQQLVLILGVIGGGIFYYRKIRIESEANALLGVVRGMGIAVSAYWSLLLIPVQMLGLFAYGSGVVMTMGIGLIAFPIFLICFALASAPMGLLAGFLSKGNTVFKRPAVWSGAALGVLLLLVVEGPSYVTRIAAKNGNVAMIRHFGDSEMLVDMVYEKRSGYGVHLDTSGVVLGLLEGGTFGRSPRASHEDYGKMYFQVTGNAMNTQSLEGRQLGRRRRGGFSEDENLGGDGVMQKVPNLDLKATRYDVHVDGASGLNYWECTYEFKNTGMDVKEARMQVLLPPDGVVSRLTLWVNGEPREAAFAATTKVAKAYKEIAVVQRKDPVLVRWVGADRVLVQCFPVPAGGEMKIRLGVSSSFEGSNKVYVPRIIEQNFAIADEAKAALWVQGDVEMEMRGLIASSASGKWREIHGVLPVKQLMHNHAHVAVVGALSASSVWTKDPFESSQEHYLVRYPNEQAAGTCQSAVLVVDGSAGVAEWKEAIEQSITDFQKAGVDLQIVVAHGDGVEVVNISEFQKVRFVGGQDNMAALLKAYELAATSKSELLVWLYGAQPIEFDAENALQQRIDYSLHHPDIVTVDLAGGPNRVLEALGKTKQIKKQFRPNLGDDLPVEAILEKAVPRYRWEYRDAVPESAQEVWDQLARWKAWQDVRYLKHSVLVVNKAAHYQLVTPVSGAVVLETEEQFKEHSLEAIDESTAPSVPSIPEPSSALLVAVGSVILLGIRKREVA